MLAVISHDAPGDRTGPETRTAFPALAVGAAFGAALAFAGVGAVTWNLGGNGIGMVAGAIVSLLAGLLALLPVTRLGSLLLLWNALGIGCAMLLIGIFSVGALVAFPLVLLAIALSSWPRRDGESIASIPAIAVQVAGFLLVPALYGLYDGPFADLLNLVGL
ncbi:MAG: hypothetical protein M3457_19070 [Chloroflexota bacterium]|nr:hypothetical protein [Chloroflexota bacterium]